MGRWLVENLLQSEERLHLTLADVDDSVLAVAEQMTERSERVVNGRQIAFPATGQVTGLSDTSSFDVILITVPTEEIEKVSQAVVSQARPGSLVLDVASVKVEPIQQMLAAAPEGVSVIGTHPMFGPRIEALTGETVAVCPTHTTNPDHLRSVVSLIKSCGGFVKQLTAEEHDEQMLIVQSLTHFMYLSLGAALRRTDTDLSDALSLQTPPFRSTVSVLGRMMDIKTTERQAQLYASIQHAAGSHQLRETFLNAAEELHRRFGEEDLDASQSAIEEIARDFSNSAIDQLSAQSDEAVRAHRMIEVKLQELKDSGDLCGLEDQDHDGEVRIGRVVEFDASSITLAGSTVNVPGKVTAIYDEESHRSASHRGITRPVKTERLQRRRYRLMEASEVLSWRETILQPHQADITLGVPRAVNATALARYLVRLIPELLSAEVGDEYNPTEPTQLRQITFKLRIVGDRDPDRAQSEFVEFFECVGGEAPRRFGPFQHSGRKVSVRRARRGDERVQSAPTGTLPG
jgi:prephenate dehydrogenase